MTSTFPDYYAILNVAQTATVDEIRMAYKKESLRCVAQPFPAYVSLIAADT